MMALAEFRTGIKNDTAGSDHGPFRLSPAEWQYLTALPEYTLAYPATDIDSWRKQIRVIAVSILSAQQKLAAILGDQPTVVELAFAQVFSTKVANTAFKARTTTVANLISGTPLADFTAEGVNSADILVRSPALNALTVDSALANFSAGLQQALDSSRPLIVQAGGTSVDSAADAADGGVNGQINFATPIIPQQRVDIAKLICTRFGEAGYNVVQQAAALASAIGESNLNPAAAAQPPEMSFGLFQLNQKGVGAGFQAATLQDPEQNIKITLDYIRVHNIPFNKAASLRDAVSVFVRQFERPANQDAAVATRFGIAEKLFA